MDLKISGTVTKVLEEQSGEGKNGSWRKQDFILRTEGDYPKEICITQWGDNIDKYPVCENDELTVYIDIQSREYNSRWYTDIKAWKITSWKKQKDGDFIHAKSILDSAEEEVNDGDIPPF